MFRHWAHNASYLLAAFVFSIILQGCGSFLKDEQDRKPLARVGEAYLYRDDLRPHMTKPMSEQDSISFVNDFINNWASEQLLLAKARINLPEEKLTEFDALVSDYRTDLYTRAYKEALVMQGSDSLVNDDQLESFYEREKENFKLKEKLVKLRYAELPPQYMNKSRVVESLKRFEAEDLDFLDSIGVQFKRLNFNDSIWITAPRIIEEIPPLTYENMDRYLKKSQFFELEDDNGVYLGVVTDVLDINEIAPLSFIEPTLRQVLLSRRKLDYIRKLETEIIDEAIREKEFEVYGQEE